jgi:hypothetical protein
MDIYEVVAGVFFLPSRIFRRARPFRGLKEYEGMKRQEFCYTCWVRLEKNHDEGMRMAISFFSWLFLGLEVVVWIL